MAVVYRGTAGTRIVVAGGEVNGLDMSQRITQSVELYDSIADSWSYLPEMSVERYGCGCGVLSGGPIVYRRVAYCFYCHYEVRWPRAGGALIV